MLSVSGLCASYGAIRAVNGLDIEVGEGRMIAVLGANGAGKSTTLRSIAGLHRPVTGSIRLDGEEISTLPLFKVVRRGLALVPEGRMVVAPLSVEENLMLSSYAGRGASRQSSRTERSQRCAPVLAFRMPTWEHDSMERWHTRIGNVDVMRVEEMLTPGFDPAFLFPDYDPEVLKEHPQLAQANFFDQASGKLMSSMHSWMLRVGRHVILIDTACGNDKVRTHPAFQRFHLLHKPYLDCLAEYGVQPEDVTLVINTHLHVDHVGWNTRLRNGVWVPTFPNARYIMGRAELAHWRDPEGGLKVHPMGAEVLVDSVNPVINAGLVDLIDVNDEVLPGISVRAMSGHTAGQLAVHVESGGW